VKEGRACDTSRIAARKTASVPADKPYRNGRQERQNRRRQLRAPIHPSTQLGMALSLSKGHRHRRFLEADAAAEPELHTADVSRLRLSSTSRHRWTLA
jgi:hypothetical protein